MDYKVFYAEVADWIHQSNQMAIKNGIESPEFWGWVSASIAGLCDKYEENPLVTKQMMMLAEWLEEAYEKMIGKEDEKCHRGDLT